MTPTEIHRDAADMEKNYPEDRLRLTGAELMAVFREQEFRWKDRAVRELLEFMNPSTLSVSVAALHLWAGNSESLPNQRAEHFSVASSKQLSVRAAGQELAYIDSSGIGHLDEGVTLGSLIKFANEAIQARTDLEAVVRELEDALDVAYMDAQERDSYLNYD